MKKFTLLFCLAISINLSSQSFFQNRFTFDYSATLNYSSTYILDLSTLSFIYVDHDFNVNMRISRKASLELISGINKVNYRYSQYNLQFNEYTYGVGFNINYGRNYAPIGNSIGLFFKINNYIVDDYNEFYAFLQSIDKDSYQTDTKINYQVATLGIKLNYIAMLSDKIPLYLKYGGSLSLPISTVIFDASYSKSSFSNYSRGLDDKDIMIDLKKKDYYKLNIGLGYMF